MTANMFLVLSTLLENLSGLALAGTSAALVFGGIIYVALLGYGWNGGYEMDRP
jgi:hypothetical protein